MTLSGCRASLVARHKRGLPLVRGLLEFFSVSHCCLNFGRVIRPRGNFAHFLRDVEPRLHQARHNTHPETTAWVIKNYASRSQIALTGISITSGSQPPGGGEKLENPFKRIPARFHCNHKRPHFQENNDEEERSEISRRTVGRDGGH